MKNNFFVAVLSMLTFGCTAIYAQSITGVVIDGTNGEPIIGANIVEKGTTNGTITDFDGNFAITVQSGAILQISYIGYKSLELPAKAAMKVSMYEDTEVLEDVVVVGYGTVKKNDATGSVTAIKPDDMNKGVQVTATDMLQGKIAGVNVISNSGAPGAKAEIRIRGGSSLNASNDPLIVIDGLAMDNNGIQGVSNPLSMINPNDIETFTVLKDASATAIYGSRASNGVIIITTKKGASGSKMKVSYDGSISIGTLVNKMQVLTADEIRAYAITSGQSMADNKYLMNDDVNWYDQIFRTSVSTDHNISLTGGFKDKNCDMPYRASIGYTLDNGTVKTSQMQRVTANLNLSPSFLDKHLTFNINAKGMYIYNHFEPGVSGAALDMDPTRPIYSDGNLTNIFGQQVPDITKKELDEHWDGYFQPLSSSTNAAGPYDDYGWMYSLRSSANPLAQFKHQDSRSNAGSFVGNIEANYKVHGFEDLQLHANFGADYSFGRTNSDNSVLGSASHYTGWHGWEKKMKYNLQFNCYAQYGHDWEEARQHFDIMAGYEWQHFYNEYNKSGAGYYPLTNIQWPGQPAYAQVGEGKGENYLVSFFGRLNYVGWNQLMITATIRGDGSSRFSKNHRWGVFPSVAVGWKIKETFMPDQNICNDLKLRLGYGITGQQEGIGDYSHLPSYTQTSGHVSYYPVGIDNWAVEDMNSKIVPQVFDKDSNMLYVSDRPNAYNDKLTWEKTTTYNVGLDFGFLNNRISGSVDYYYRKTTDLLNNVTVAMGTNFRKHVMSNVGSLTNQGVEVSLNAVILDYGKKFKWDFGCNVTWNENKITKINGEDDMIDGNGTAGSGIGGKHITKYAVGYATNSFFLYQTQSAYTEEGKKYWYIVDANHDGEINTADQVLLRKSPIAPVTMGFQMKFQFYGFDLGMSFHANVGNYVFNNVVATRLATVSVGALSRDGYYKTLPAAVFDTYYNDAYTTTICNKDGTPSTFTEYDVTDRFLEDASFLRCDNITLGYSFTTKNSKLSGRAYCTVSNPFVITKYSGLDPEIGSYGIDNTIYPRCMTTILGINLQF
ncbi:MAG: TonB-dependent receptor [Paludibacteraceae bacterium]|nr:TonB-dependent receptor [Paludibacteraceae bacterium]